jgi:hypothetical protein
MTGIALACALLATGGSAFAKHHTAVFKVLPTGTNDTANLQAAFDAAVQAGPGSTVQLVKGTYYIDTGVVVANFDGKFVGAGKGKTFVQNLGTTPFPSPELLNFHQDQTGGPSSITVSDLTFRAIGLGTPINGINSMSILGLYGKFTGVPDDEVAFLNTSVVRVGFEGQSDANAFGGYNLYNAILVSGAGDAGYLKPVTGTQLVQECTFKNALGGWITDMLQDSRLKIEGCAFDDVRNPIGIYDLSNSTADIRCNRLRNATWNGGVYILTGLQWLNGHGNPPAPSTFRISHNEISNSLYADGIALSDLPGFFLGETSFEHTVIDHNDICLLGADSTGAVFGIAASGVTVADNRISGQGAYGIYMGVLGDLVSDWVIVGNCLKDADTVNSPILLGPGTSHCFVVADPADVLDMGTDNTVVDVHAKHCGDGDGRH